MSSQNNKSALQEPLKPIIGSEWGDWAEAEIWRLRAEVARLEAEIAKINDADYRGMRTRER